MCCVCLSLRVTRSVCAYVFVERLRVWALLWRGWPHARRKRAAGQHARVRIWCHRPGSRALAAGVSWTSRTASALWAGRAGHTSVIDAAGAIYVIGGYTDGTLYQDMWVSTDGGA